MRHVALWLSVLGLAAGAFAGIDPEPFKLQAVENTLDAHFHHLDRVLAEEPDPVIPVLNQLGAIGINLGRLEDRVVSVMGIEPVPFTPEVREALEDVRSAAEQIADRAEAGFVVPPDPADEEDLLGALAVVKAGAEGIIFTVNGFLEVLGACCWDTVCQVTPEAECSAEEGIFQGAGTECTPTTCP